MFSANSAYYSLSLAARACLNWLSHHADLRPSGLLRLWPETLARELGLEPGQCLKALNVLARRKLCHHEKRLPVFWLPGLVRGPDPDWASQLPDCALVRRALAACQKTGAPSGAESSPAKPPEKPQAVRPVPRDYGGAGTGSQGIASPTAGGIDRRADPLASASRDAGQPRRGHARLRHGSGVGARLAGFRRDPQLGESHEGLWRGPEMGTARELERSGQERGRRGELRETRPLLRRQRGAHQNRPVLKRPRGRHQNRTVLGCPGGRHQNRPININNLINNNARAEEELININKYNSSSSTKPETTCQTMRYLRSLPSASQSSSSSSSSRLSGRKLIQDMAGESRDFDQAGGTGPRGMREREAALPGEGLCFVGTGDQARAPDGSGQVERHLSQGLKRRKGGASRAMHGGKKAIGIQGNASDLAAAVSAGVHGEALRDKAALAPDSLRGDERLGSDCGVLPAECDAGAYLTEGNHGARDSPEQGERAGLARPGLAGTESGAPDEEAAAYRCRGRICYFHNCQGEMEWISAESVNFWAMAFPQLDIDQELAGIAVWLQGHYADPLRSGPLPGRRYMENYIANCLRAALRRQEKKRARAKKRPEPAQAARALDDILLRALSRSRDYADRIRANGD